MSVCPPGQVASGPVCLRAAGVSAGRVRDLARGVLSGREFHPRSRSILARIDSWLAQVFDHAFRTLSSSGPAAIVALIVVTALLAAVALLATRFVGRVRRDPGVEVDRSSPVQRTAAEWGAEAARHEAAGEWREAVRCRYRALVSDLADRGLVEEVPGRTARDYEASVGQRLPGAAAAFNEASDLFEAAWYGNRPGSAADHQRFAALVDRVLVDAGRA